MSSNPKDPNLSKEEQENAAAEKAGALAGRAVADYATGGKYEQLRSAPVVGKALQKAEDKVGKKVGQIDKATGGKLGKAAKKADDIGALDAADKGMGALGGGKPGSGTPNAGGMSASKAPNPVSAPDTSNTGQNFAKNGLTSGGGSEIAPKEGTGAERKRMSDINDRKQKLEQETQKAEEEVSKAQEKEDQNEERKSKAKIVIKTVVLHFFGPLIIGLFCIFFLIAIFTAVFSNDNDLAAVDLEAGYGGDSTSYYANSSPEAQAFYKMVLDIAESYTNSGKKVNTMYVTATYHILKEKNQFLAYSDFDESLIKEMYDAMLGGSSTYSESKYRTYLTNEFFPRYNCDEELSKILTDKVFDYINKYLEKNGRLSDSCSNVTGGACDYTFTGIVTGSGTKINKSFSVKNLKVRLMSNTSSYCSGPNNNAMAGEDLYDFEYYVLGSAYGEIGTAGFSKEVEKAHTIVSRSFSLARGIEMNGGMNVKYTNENGQDILQMRPCVADHLFCNPDKGCSADGVIQSGSYGHELHSGLSHPTKWMGPLDESGNKTLKEAWQETMGMVGVDAEGRVVETGFAIGQGNQDDWVWKRWAEQGMDYVQILLSAYPNIKEIKKFGCDTTTEETGNSFTQTASTVWKKIANGGYSYSMSGVSIPPSGSYIDCSSFVSWVLYEYGFKDEFGGGQHNTVAFLNTNWSEKMGWTEIPVGAGEDVTSQLQPGDILVRDTGAGGANGHINIIGEITSDGRVLAYDCGDSSNWNNATAREGKPVDRTSFAKSDYRSGKIIRVSNSSGNSCTTAASGEWSTWRQYAPAPWSEIPLGNSGRTIGGYGCFVTSIAIQIARSGAQTTLSEFNPGTFVQELNKYGSFDGYGNFIGGGNIVKIVPTFETVATAVSLPSDKAGKIRTIQSYIDQGYYVNLRVKTTTGQHWVAVIGTTNDGVQMVDPGSDATVVWDQYPMSESSTINIYKIG